MKALGLLLCIPLLASLYVYFFATPAAAQATGMTAQSVSIAASLTAFALGLIIMMLGKRVAQRESEK
jgi:membrane protein implicated in regulation of membrane protease activity